VQKNKKSKRLYMRRSARSFPQKLRSTFAPTQAAEFWVPAPAARLKRNRPLRRANKQFYLLLLGGRREQAGQEYHAEPEMLARQSTCGEGLLKFFAGVGGNTVRLRDASRDLNFRLDLLRVVMRFFATELRVAMSMAPLLALSGQAG
jgi:hypothetical protein